MGLMAGISILCISVNALMDFPMQLPTAPAAAALLLGLVLSIYMRRNPEKVVGPKVVITTGHFGPAVLFVIMSGVFGWAIYDCYLFRQSNSMLKQGMIRIFSGVNDETTIGILQSAWAMYPYDQRIQEHIGVAYANYNGKTPISIDERIKKLEWVHGGDPWGANHMINLSGLYLQKAQDAQAAKNQPEMDMWLAKADGMFVKLQKVADFSHFTWGIGGMVRMLQGNNTDAIWMFRRALAIEPGYMPAEAGLNMSISASGVKPVIVRDNLTGATQ
jgi:hypothetical protein